MDEKSFIGKVAKFGGSRLMVEIPKNKAHNSILSGDYVLVRVIHPKEDLNA